MLHSQTLALASTWVLVTLGCILVFLQRTRKTYPGFSCWSGAFVAIAVGYGCLMLRGIAPDWVSILLANGLLMTGMVLTFDGVTIFSGRQWTARLNAPLLVALAGGEALLAYFTYVENNLNARIATVNLFRFASYSACVFALIRFRAAETRAAQDLLAAVFLASALLGAIRAAIATTAPVMVSLYDDPVFRLFMLLDLGVMIGIAFCFLLITHMRIEQELEQERSVAQRASLTDKLTGLRNRSHFEAEVERRLLEADRFSDDLSLLMIDIDHFKTVNDRFGHPVGDEVLREIAGRIGARLRASDLFCRWGGEEFVVLIRTGIDHAATVAETLRMAVAERPFAIVGRIAISIGVADRRHHEDLSTWMVRVDQALYRAKENGRNRVEKEAVHDKLYSVGDLTWNASFSVGDPVLDVQHRALFEKAGLLSEKCASRDGDGAFDVFSQLLDDADRHYLYEEHLLRARNYPDVEAHIGEHQRLRQRGRQLLNDFTAGRASLDSLGDYAVKELVLGHIAEEDKRYFPMLALSA